MKKAPFFYIFRQAYSFIIQPAMQVYIEYALAENFCMDFCLLFAAKAITKNRAGLWRISMASVLGACFAVAFPLFGLGGWIATAIKLLAGALLCLAAGIFKSVKAYLKYTAAFSLTTFALGGGLIAVFSLTGTAYSQGGGVILSSVPVGIPLFAALALALAVKKIASKFISKRAKTYVACRIYAGQRSIKVNAFFDSGNKVYRMGSPVSVISSGDANKIVNVDGIKNFVSVHTVSGKGKLPVFTADKIEIDYGERIVTLRGVLFCVSSCKDGLAVLHPDIAEAE